MEYRTNLFYKSVYFCHVHKRNCQFFGLIKSQISDEKCIFVGLAEGYPFVVTNGFIYSSNKSELKFNVSGLDYKQMLEMMKKYFIEFCDNTY